RHLGAVAEEVEHPTGPRHELRQERHEVGEAPGDHLGGAVAYVPLAHPSDGSVYRDDERRIAAGLGARDGIEAHVATAAQVQLVPGGSPRRLPDLFESRAGERGEGVDRAGPTGRGGRLGLAARPEHAARADWGQDHRHGYRLAEHRRSQLDLRVNDRGPGPPRQLRVGGLVGTQRALVLGSAVYVVERHARQAASSQLAQVSDAYDRWS